MLRILIPTLIPAQLELKYVPPTISEHLITINDEAIESSNKVHKKACAAGSIKYKLHGWRVSNNQ